ncbi:MAG: hypothetical protein IJH32_01445 [Ruminococcus sp.]|nr:hypothetical protein [Ruminococcus sp.]
MKKYLIWYYVLALIIFADIVAFVLSASTCISYKGLAADSRGNIYIGEEYHIKVYDSHGEFVRCLSANTNRGYSFTIKDDSIIEFASSDVIIMDLFGEIMKEYDDSDYSHYMNYINPRSYTASDGTKYVMENHLLREKVYKISPSSDRELIFEMPMYSYVVRLLMVFAALNMVIIIPIFIIKGVKKQLKKMK